MRTTGTGTVRSRRVHRYAATIAALSVLAVSIFSIGFNNAQLTSIFVDRPEIKHTEREPGRKLAHLTCKQYGNTSQDVVNDMVYWYDIPSDQNYLNPFQEMTVKSDIEKFLLFEQDGAGFNNRRMSIETILTMGISMGRTIVPPPEQPIYMLEDRGKQRHRFSFEDFFPLEAAQLEHAGIKIITMKEFLEQVLKEGLIKDRESRLLIFPPNNRTDWNDAHKLEMKDLHTWLSHSSYAISGWKSSDCISVWPKDTAMDKSTMDALTNKRKKVHSRDSPVAVNASALDRFDEQRAERSDLCLYDKAMQEEQFIYFRLGHSYDKPGNKGNRFLSPFYTFHFYEDWNQALWMRRFVRDHLRYHDELYCAAAKIVDALRKRVRKRGLLDNPDGSFSTSESIFNIPLVVYLVYILCIMVLL